MVIGAVGISILNVNLSIPGEAILPRDSVSHGARPDKSSLHPHQAAKR